MLGDLLAWVSAWDERRPLLRVDHEVQDRMWRRYLWMTRPTWAGVQPSLSLQASRARGQGWPLPTEWVALRRKNGLAP